MNVHSFVQNVEMLFIFNLSFKMPLWSNKTRVVKRLVHGDECLTGVLRRRGLYITLHRPSWKLIKWILYRLVIVKLKWSGAFSFSFLTCFQCLSFFLFFFLFVFLGPHLWYMEVPRLGVQLELQLPVYTTTTATQDPSHVCDLHHSSQQHQVLNPMSEARDQTWVLMDASWVR